MNPIDRQAAIDALDQWEYSHSWSEWCNDRKDEKELFHIFPPSDCVRNLPSAQPEIIRCRDCMLMLEDKIFHRCWCNGREVKPDHFCGYAERKENVQ